MTTPTMTASDMTAPEALALIEFVSIAIGTRAVDALVKQAPVVLERVGTLQPGKMAVMFSGDVASVELSHAAAITLAKHNTSDQLLLPYVHPSVYHAVQGHIDDWSGDSIGVVETNSMSACIHAADVAVKGAQVRVVELRLGDELGGKGLLYLAGQQHDMEAALELVVERTASADRNIITSLTARIDEEVRAKLRLGTRFWSRPRRPR